MGSDSGLLLELDAWAPYYDLVHQGLSGEAEFYVGQALRHGGEALELGCGTGRICIAMAMSGVRATGLDFSPAMLDICREKYRAVGEVRGALELRRADMRDFDLGARFRFIAMPYRAFMHLLTAEDQLACLSSVRKHLRDDGCFILNLWAARPSAIAGMSAGGGDSDFALAGIYPVPGGDTSIVHFHAARYDEHEQLIVERHRMQEKDPSGAFVREETLTMTRSWIGPREMEHLVGRAGFAVDAVLGDFDAHPFGPESTEMIWVLRKGDAAPVR